MTVLDVGQGLAVVVETHRHALVYDTGPRYSDEADAGGRLIAPFLRAEGIRSLAGMIVTHQDSDHSGGALTLLQTVPVGWLASSLPAEHAILLRRVADGGEVARCESGQGWTWDDVRFTVLHPTAAHYAMAGLKPNDLSCVVRIESSHGSVLLTGDLEARGERGAVGATPRRSRRTYWSSRITAAGRPRRRRSSRRSLQTLRCIPLATGIDSGTDDPTLSRDMMTPEFGATGPISMARSRSRLHPIRRTRRGPSASTTAATGTTRRCGRRRRRSIDPLSHKHCRVGAGIALAMKSRSSSRDRRALLPALGGVFESVRKLKDAEIVPVAADDLQADGKRGIVARESGGHRDRGMAGDGDVVAALHPVEIIFHSHARDLARPFFGDGYGGSWLTGHSRKS